jgi:NADH:ubiquinone oxidoreductase subunit
MKLIKAFKKFGFKECLRRIIYHNGVLMYGECVGEDAIGNKYFEVREPEYQIVGRLRYVEYRDAKNSDASLVQPDWYLIIK